MPKLDAVVPILNVSNVAASLAYYVDVLGFDASWHWGHPPTFGGVRTGGGEIQFCQDGQGQRGTWFSVWVDDVDALYERLRAGGGATSAQEPTTFEWGVRELNVADPDGHRIRFSMSTTLPPDGRNFLTDGGVTDSTGRVVPNLGRLPSHLADAPTSGVLSRTGQFWF